ncbi:MAG: hypothetical protein M1820_006980 [Bogoriella megaspora]|nr:MAG: hypothetical protein M1820_006980 [Bogoriella megaspora]
MARISWRKSNCIVIVDAEAPRLGLGIPASFELSEKEFSGNLLGDFIEGRLKGRWGRKSRTRRVSNRVVYQRLGEKGRVLWVIEDPDPDGLQEPAARWVAASQPGRPTTPLARNQEKSKLPLQSVIRRFSTNHEVGQVDKPQLRYAITGL